MPIAAPDVLVLGCTHFPPLAGCDSRGGGRRQCASSIPPSTTAEALAQLLARATVCARPAAPGTAHFLVTDGEERFARVGPVFLGRAIASTDIERVDLLTRSATA